MEFLVTVVPLFEVTNYQPEIVDKTVVCLAREGEGCGVRRKLSEVAQNEAGSVNARKGSQQLFGLLSKDTGCILASQIESRK